MILIVYSMGLRLLVVIDGLFSQTEGFAGHHDRSYIFDIYDSLHMIRLQNMYEFLVYFQGDSKQGI